MTALDTNVIVRMLVKDDPKQAEKAFRFFLEAEKNQESLHVPLMVVLELIWVLESCYRKTREEILSAIEDMLQMPVFEFEKDEVVEYLMDDGRNGKTDLDDILIARSAIASGCDSGVTFDESASQHPFYRLLR